MSQEDEIAAHGVMSFALRRGLNKLHLQLTTRPDTSFDYRARRVPAGPAAMSWSSPARKTFSAGDGFSER